VRHVSDRFAALLDANVLYPFLVRDVLLSLAEAGLFRPLWTDSINDEWARALIERMPERKEQIAETISLMNEAFPEARIENYEDLVPVLELPDPNDRHVLAAAIRGAANVIVTENIADFPRQILDRYDLDSRTADEFILNTTQLYPSDAAAALKAMRERYQSPPLSPDELLQSMLKAGLVTTVAELTPQKGAL
jgi:predicted nucleic acid-binding protein